MWLAGCPIYATVPTHQNIDYAAYVAARHGVETLMKQHVVKSIVEYIVTDELSDRTMDVFKFVVTVAIVQLIAVGGWLLLH